MYLVRRVHLVKTDQLDTLAHACGELYSRTLVFFWRTVRHTGIWLRPKHLMRLFPNDEGSHLHAHTADACVQAFFSALSSWRERRVRDPKAHPPRRRKWYFRVEYKSSAINLKDSLLTLSNGKGNAPLTIAWKWSLPKTVVIHWTGTGSEAIATYKLFGPALPEEEEPDQQARQRERVAGIDPGEIHPAVSYDGIHCHLLNGRFLRSLRQYRNKLIEHPCEVSWGIRDPPRSRGHGTPHRMWVCSAAARVAWRAVVKPILQEATGLLARVECH